MLLVLLCPVVYHRQSSQPQSTWCAAWGTEQTAVSSCCDSSESSWHSGDVYFFKIFWVHVIHILYEKYILTPVSCITLFTLLLPLFKARHYQTPGFSSSSAEHGQFSGGQAVHEPYGVTQAQHPSTYAPGPSVPVSFASSSQIRGKGWDYLGLFIPIRSVVLENIQFLEWICWVQSSFNHAKPYENAGVIIRQVPFVPKQVHLHFKPCSISPTSSQATQSTVTSPPSLVRSPVVTVFHCSIFLMTECRLCSIA